MIKIEIGNVKCQLIGLTTEETNLLSDLLSFETPGAEFMMRNNPWKWDGKTRLLKKKSNGTCEFPTGLLVSVLKHFKKRAIEWEGGDERTKPEPTHAFKMDGITLRDFQKDLVEVTDKRTRGVIKVGTGGGKTISAAAIIERKQVDTLFIVPALGLKKQTQRTFAKIFGEEFVGTCVTEKKPIIVSNIQSLVKKDKKLFERFKMKLVDEFHHSAAKSYQTVNDKCVEAYYRYGLTGTFVRPDGKDMVMHGVLSNVIYEKSASELIEMGWLVPPLITMVEHRFKGWSTKNYRKAYDDVCEDPSVIGAISDIAHRKGIDEKKQVIILVRKVEHGAYLQRIISDSVFLDGSIPIGERERIQDEFNSGIIPIVIATSVFGEGIDIPNIDVLINARFQKSEVQTAQGIGRALRTTDGMNVFDPKYLGKTGCEVYDFMFKGNKHLFSHSEERLKTYENETAFKIQTIELSTIF